jgi:hypothetical protein
MNSDLLPAEALAGCGANPQPALAGVLIGDPGMGVGIARPKGAPEGRFTALAGTVVDSRDVGGEGGAHHKRSGQKHAHVGTLCQLRYKVNLLQKN